MEPEPQQKCQLFVFFSLLVLCISSKLIYWIRRIGDTVVHTDPELLRVLRPSSLRLCNHMHDVYTRVYAAVS